MTTSARLSLPARTLLVAGLVGAMLIVAWAPDLHRNGIATAVAADAPTPSAGSGDTRSAGQGPGIVGSPLAAIGGVLAVALVAGAGTMLYVRVRPTRETSPSASDSKRSVERDRAGRT